MRFLQAQEIDEHRRDADGALRTLALGDLAHHRLVPDLQHDTLDGEGACVEIERVEGKPEQLGPAHPCRQQGRDDRVRLAIVEPPRRAGCCTSSVVKDLTRCRRGVGARASLAGFSAIIFHSARLLERVAEHAMHMEHGARRQRPGAFRAVRIELARDPATSQQRGIELIEVGGRELLQRIWPMWRQAMSACQR